MRSRQVVCNDSRVVELLSQFIPTADNPGRYITQPPQRPAARTDALEYDLLERAMLQTSWRDLVKSHPGRWDLQGIYMITPSGKVLAGSNHPMNAEINLKSMRQAL